jgi:hypothetical protein
MAHHKRKGPKSTRAGCLLCKPQKRQGAPLLDRSRHQVIKGQAIAREKTSEAFLDRQ